MPRGGFRPGAGRKTADYVRPAAVADFEIERARHEKIKADQRAFKLDQERALYLPREAYRQANAVLLSMVTQSLRAIPDNLERTLGLPPAAIEATAQQIDAALAELAKGLQAVTETPVS